MGIMEIFKNPNKKPRLDLASNYGNDDLWGDDEDITAEEFDRLEVQATQATNQENHTSNVSLRSFRNTCTEEVTSLQAEERKQQQYELEGKVKLLNDSLERMSKELKEEKLHKERLVSRKIDEFLEKESTLHREIEKLQSALQFKDQEMKAVYEKVHGLEIQLQEKTMAPETLCTKTSSTFLNKIQFQNTCEINPEESKPSRKHKLLVSSSQGKTTGSDIVLSILCNRLELSTAPNPYFTPVSTTQPSIEQVEMDSAELSAVSIARINSDQQTEELFDYFIFRLKNYICQLKNFSPKISSALISSPLSIRKKDLNHERTTVMSCLKDMSHIISCPQTFMVKQTEDVISHQKVNEQFANGLSNFEFTSCDKRWRSKLKSLLQLLISLIHPDTYPPGLTNNEDIEWSLAALVSWSSSAPENLIGFLDEIPLSLIMNCIHNSLYSYMSLKLITNLCIYKEFIPSMMHRNDACLFCSIAELSLHKISTSVLQFSKIILVVENFFSAVFTAHGFCELNLESSPCSSTILHGLIRSLQKFYEVYDKNNEEIILVIKRGFSLVHLLSRYLPNFKGKRLAFEDSYISLVCSMLQLSKENSAFKDFQDIIHDLWDFQEDINELELEESSEDTSLLCPKD